MAESRNIPAVKLAERVGMSHRDRLRAQVRHYSPVLPFLPVALGAADVTLYEQTAAFTLFPTMEFALSRATSAKSLTTKATCWKKIIPM